MRYLQSTVQCTDDCIDQPSCNIGVSYQDEEGDDRCGNTLVTVTSTDWYVGRQGKAGSGWVGLPCRLQL